MKKTLTAVALTLPVLLSGCVISVDGDERWDRHSSWEKREKDNREQLNRLAPGLAVNEVKARMGMPDFNELYPKGDDNVQVLYYRTHRRDGDGVTTKDECTPLVFKNDALVGWGETAFNSL